MESDFRVVNTLLDAKGPISCVRFSPDGYRMVAASLDGNLYIYCVRKNFKLEVPCGRNILFNLVGVYMRQRLVIVDAVPSQKCELYPKTKCLEY